VQDQMRVERRRIDTRSEVHAYDDVNHASSMQKCGVFTDHPSFERSLFVFELRQTRTIMIESKEARIWPQICIGSAFVSFSAISERNPYQLHVLVSLSGLQILKGQARCGCCSRMICVHE